MKQKAFSSYQRKVKKRRYRQPKYGQISKRMKAEFDRLESELATGLKDFNDFIENDSETRESLYRIENELKRMELKL